MFRLRSSSALFKVARNFSDFSKSDPLIRWMALYPKEYPYLKYLKKNNFGNNYITEVNAERLNNDFGKDTFNDFFRPDAVVDLLKLFKSSYDDLKDNEQRQRRALRQEFESIFKLLKFRLALGRSIHFRDIEQIKQIAHHEPSFKEWFQSIFSKEDFYKYIESLPQPNAHEITFITDHEFAYYPFLAPFSFENLSEITLLLEKELQHMPQNFAGILGTLPLALTEYELDILGIKIDPASAGKHDLYLVNTSIVVTGRSVITLVHKLNSSPIDIRYPIPKYVMHDGLIYLSKDSPDYQPEAMSQIEPQTMLRNLNQNALLTLEARASLYPNYTDIPLLNIQHTKERIAKLEVGGKKIYILPEICIEHEKGLSKDYWNEYQALLKKENVTCFKEASFSTDESFSILHVLIASGAPAIKLGHIVGESLLVHDRSHNSTFITGKDGARTSFDLFTQKLKVNMAIFRPHEIELIEDTCSNLTSHVP